MSNNPSRALTLATIEERAATIWAEVLGVAKERADATFFELQGQSISAVRIAARIEDELDVRIDASILFDDPDRATFVRAVVATASAQRNSEDAG